MKVKPDEADPSFGCDDCPNTPGNCNAECVPPDRTSREEPAKWFTCSTCRERVTADNEGCCTACGAKQSTPDAEPTPAAKDEPPPKHECPYGGVVEERPQWPVSATLDGPIYGPVAYARWPCGWAGRLCDCCREDRDDARSKSVCEALDTSSTELHHALVALLGAITAETGRADARTRALVRAIIRSTDTMANRVAYADSILQDEGLLPGKENQNV